MLINLKRRINEESTQELLSYAVFPDPDHLRKTIDEYKTKTSLELFGSMVEQRLIGIIGFLPHKDKSLEIKHIAVDPEFRGNGYGRGMILDLLELRNPALIKAETDEDAVDFYRNVGFMITSLGEKYPGVERFLCEYDVILTEDSNREY